MRLAGPILKTTTSLLALAAFCTALQPAQAEAVFTKDTTEGQALSLPIYSWSDTQTPAKAIIVAVHGVTLYSANFNETAKHLASDGYPVYAVDMRGFGRWQTESATFSGDSQIHYTQSQQDLETLLKKLHSEFPGKKIYLLGESIGANMGIWVASKDPDLIDGLILASPCIKACFHPMPRMVPDFFRGLMHPNTKHQTRPYIKPYISDDKRVTAEYFADPVIMHKMSPVEMFKSLKTNTRSLLAAKDIPTQFPILIVAGKRDKIYHADAIPLFLQQIGAENTTVVIEEKKGHLLLETKYVEPKILSVIDTWLAKHVTVKPEKPEEISSAAQPLAQMNP
ncbi:MAG TPA: alpha/beta fold hydrolase [Oculatellaceae cyanobacterium]